MEMRSLLVVLILCLLQVLQSQTLTLVKRKCGGQSVSINCPNGLIIVEYANYGRTTTNSHVCPYHTTHVNIATCTRDEQLYTSLAKNLCDGKQSCTVRVLDLGDACVGTYKYLEVKYSCTPTIAPLVAIKCGHPLRLQCLRGLIQVEYANYGRTKPSSQVCPYHTTHKDEVTCTRDEEAYTKHVQIWCDGKQSCFVERLNLGDACIGTYKYLEVEYNCRRTAAALVARNCSGNSVSLDCPSGLIEVEYANYGRTTTNSHVCPYYTTHLNINTCTRDEELYTDYAKNLCDGRQSCTVVRLSLGDPCVGTFKYLEVKYSCTSVELGPAPAKAGPVSECCGLIFAEEE